jgi:hypothetical protein
MNLRISTMFAALGVAALGCGVAEDATEASFVNVGAQSSELGGGPFMHDGFAVEPVALMGKYGHDCVMNGGDKWDLELNNPADRSVEVVLNDTFGDCPLTWTGVRLQAGHHEFKANVTPPIRLGLDYATSPSTVYFPGSSLLFYTNAELLGLASESYTNDFTVHMIYSDDAKVCGEKAPPAIYAVVTGTAEGEPVPPPDYDLGFDKLQLVVDADKIVQQTSTGGIVLEQNEQAGEEWKLFDLHAYCCEWFTFGLIDELYRNGEAINSGVLDAGDVTIPWTELGLGGERLPETRVIVVKHTGEGGVYSYELFQILFPGPETDV